MECGKVLALLSLAASLLLLADALPPSFGFGHGSSRLRGSPVADLLHAALARLQGVDVVALATRRNMVLLCHAILLLLLGDAGVLSVPARRRAVPVRAEDATSPRGGVVWRRRARHALLHTKNVEEEPCAAPSLLTQPGHGHDVEFTKEIVHHLVAFNFTAAGEPAAKDFTYSMTMDAQVPDHNDHNGADEDQAVDEAEPAHPAAAHERGEEEQDEDEDLAEMNRRFEAFIADTKAKMRMEALQPAGGMLTA